MSSYQLPPLTENRNGNSRRVGVEIEFGGITGLEAANAIQHAVGGSVEELTPHRFQISATPLGDLVVELDVRFAHSDEPERELELAQAARKTLGDIVQVVVPHELVTPPLPITELELIDPVVDALREAGAIGTASNPFHAFGLHLNPEVASIEPNYLLNILRAFVLLNQELRDKIRPDMTRRLLSWAAAYDDQYHQTILAPDYLPSFKQLVTDYVAANPGRNYDLDMFPLFAEIDEPLMEGLVGDLMSSPRPTFHYRLPDCRIDEADWGIAADWNRWVEVEELANDPDRLLERSQQYFTRDNNVRSLTAGNDN